MVLGGTGVHHEGVYVHSSFLHFQLLAIDFPFA